MFEPIFEIMQKGRARFERVFHGYDIHETAEICRGTKIIYNDKRRKGQLTMKRLSWIGTDCIIDITRDVTLGEYVQLAPRVMIFTHDSSRSMKNPKEGEVNIGDRAYIGAGAILLPGIKIGKGSIVGAGAVVTMDVKEGSVVGGVPAKIIKE